MLTLATCEHTTNGQALATALRFQSTEINGAPCMVKTCKMVSLDLGTHPKRHISTSIKRGAKNFLHRTPSIDMPTMNNDKQENADSALSSAPCSVTVQELIDFYDRERFAGPEFPEYREMMTRNMNDLIRARNFWISCKNISQNDQA